MEDALDSRQNGLPLLPVSLYDVLCNMLSLMLVRQILGHYRCAVPFVLLRC